MSFSRGESWGIVRGLMRPSTRAITTLFLLLVAAGHQPSELSVIEVVATGLTREGAVECSALPIGAMSGTAGPLLPAAPPARAGASLGSRRHRVMVGDLPAPRAPDA